MRFLTILTLLLLTACADTQPTPTDTTPSDDPHDVKALADTLNPNDSDTPINPIITPDGKTQIDWSHIHTKEPKADLATYTYPIALDSTAVKNYAQAYNISDKEAQHSLVVGMASPEALGKVLDQLRDGKYLGHELTDGAVMTLIIHTTPDVVADKVDYVFADTFGRGLVLPVEIRPREGQ